MQCSALMRRAIFLVRSPKTSLNSSLLVDTSTRLMNVWENSENVPPNAGGTSGVLRMLGAEDVLTESNACNWAHEMGSTKCWGDACSGDVAGSAWDGLSEHVVITASG